MSFSSIAATPVISAASSAGMAGGTGSIAAAPMPAPTVAVRFARAGDQFVGELLGTEARELPAQGREVPHRDARGDVDDPVGEVGQAALALLPPLRTPFLAPLPVSTAVRRPATAREAPADTGRSSPEAGRPRSPFERGRRGPDEPRSASRSAV